MDKLDLLQAEQLKIFKIFMSICKKYSLRYFPVDGTLLGAVRHCGFIPWDDDIDVGMPRPDYEKFISICSSELPDSFYLEYFNNAPFNKKDIFYVSRIRNSQYKIKTNFFGEETIEDVFIDIVPLDGMPDNKLLCKIHQYHLLLLKAIAKLSQDEYIGIHLKNRHLYEKIIIKIGKTFKLGRFINTQKCYIYLDSALKKYKYNNANYVVDFPSDYRFKEMVPKEYYEPAKEIKFEDTLIPCPNRAEDILSQLYGDYLKYPPLNERKKHPIEIIDYKGGQPNARI